MDCKEITDLIAIRKYVAESSNSFTIDRATLNDLNGMLLLLDKKIIGLICSGTFKEYIGYNNVKQAIQDAARLSNIQSGLKK